MKCFVSLGNRIFMQTCHVFDVLLRFFTFFMLLIHIWITNCADLDSLMSVWFIHPMLWEHVLVPMRKTAYKSHYVMFLECANGCDGYV